MELPPFKQGFTWVPHSARDLLIKSQSPDFLFVSSDEFVTSNINQRLNKRSIHACVSVLSPYGVLLREHPAQSAVECIESKSASKEYARALVHVRESLEAALMAGADSIVLCDDIAGSQSPLQSPFFVLEHLMPLYEKLIDLVHDHGVPVIFHAHGDVQSFYPGLKDAGVDAVHVSHAPYETYADLVRAAWKLDLPVFGGILTSVPHLSFEQVASFAADLLEEARQIGSKLFVCDDGGLDGKEKVLLARDVINHVVR